MRIGFLIHRIAQEFFLWLQYPYQMLLNTIFRLLGKRRLFVIRHSGDYDRAKVVSPIVEVLRDSVQIKIALGEMGHRVIDHPEVLGAIAEAYLNNDATIEIVHGPRVDPETKEIFKFAEQGIVKIYRRDEYNRRHFILAQKESGDIAVMDEGVHNEALWAEDKSGNHEQVYSSRYRIYQFLKQSGRLAKKLDREFEHRKANCSPSSSHPGYVHSYTHPLRRVWVKGVLNFPYRWITQPLEALLDYSPTVPYKLKRMTVEHQSKPSEYIEVSFVLATQENALELLLLLDEVELITTENILKEFDSAALSVEQTAQTVTTLSELNIIKLTDNQVGLTDRGKKLARTLSALEVEQ